MSIGWRGRTVVGIKQNESDNRRQWWRLKVAGLLQEVSQRSLEYYVELAPISSFDYSVCCPFSAGRSGCM